MYIFINASTDPSFDPSIDPSTHRSIHLSSHPPANPSMHQTIQPSFDASIDPSIDPYTSIHRSTHPSIHPSIHLSLHLSRYQYFDPSIYPSSLPLSVFQLSIGLPARPCRSQPAGRLTATWPLGSQKRRSLNKPLIGTEHFRRRSAESRMRALNRPCRMKPAGRLSWIEFGWMELVGSG